MTTWDGTPSRETLVIVGYIVPTVLLVASTVLRLFAKISKEGLHLDDYLIILASVCLPHTRTGSMYITTIADHMSGPRSSILGNNAGLRYVKWAQCPYNIIFSPC